MNDSLVSRLLPGSLRAVLRKLGGGLCFGLIGCLLGGCVPLAPYSSEPRFYGSGRALLDGVPSFILVGQTSRAEVLKELGTAEVQAADGSWMYYESDYLRDESGYWFLVLAPYAGPGRMTTSNTMVFRRLLIHFSGDSVVTSADFYAQECKDIWRIHDERQDLPEKVLQSCDILKRGVELRRQREHQRYALGILAADGPTERFDLALWNDGNSEGFLGTIRRGLQCTPDVLKRDRGILAISNQALIFLPKVAVPSGAPPEPIRVPLADIAAVSEIGALLIGSVSVDVKRHDGTYVSFALCKETFPYADSQRVTAARILLERRLSKSAEE